MLALGTQKGLVRVAADFQGDDAALHKEEIETETNSEGEALTLFDLGQQDQCYGCLSVRSGRETWITNQINETCGAITAKEILQMKHKSSNGQRFVQPTQMMPGYVFFKAEADFIVQELTRLKDVYRVLKSNDGLWSLAGGDLDFAQWVFKYDGMIGLSKAYREGDCVKIISGPMKDYEGQILRIDRRNRNGLVAIGFDRQIFQTWLAFEWLDEIG
ncbi:MAG: hypothetical protein RSA65_01625 [Clostridia bacterium]